MSIYAATLARLAEHPETAARFGSDVASSRVYSHKVATGVAYPHARVTRVSNPDVATHSTGDGDLYKPTIQIDVVGDDLDVVLAAAEEIREAMRTWVGEYAGLFIRRAFKDVDFDDSEDPQEGSEDDLYRVVLRYEVWYNTRA